MSISDQPRHLAFDPLRLSARSLAVKYLFVLAGTLVLALASQIAVPMVPVRGRRRRKPARNWWLSPNSCRRR